LVLLNFYHQVLIINSSSDFNDNEEKLQKTLSFSIIPDTNFLLLRIRLAKLFIRFLPSDGYLSVTFNNILQTVLIEFGSIEFRSERLVSFIALIQS
jgi:hypothetical protein